MEWYESLKEHISYRLSNPFTPAFLLSWSVLNFKTILTVFSSVPLKEKIDFLDETYSHETLLDTGYMQGLVLPAAFACLFVLISPWFSAGVGLYWKWQKNKVKGWSIFLDEGVPRSSSEFVEQREKYSEHLKEKDVEIDRLHGKSEGLAVTIRRLEEQVEALGASHSEIREKLRNAQLENANAVAERDSSLEDLNQYDQKVKKDLIGYKALIVKQQKTIDAAMQLLPLSQRRKLQKEASTFETREHDVSDFLNAQDEDDPVL